jgi:PEP-CTERM motif
MSEAGSMTEETHMRQIVFAALVTSLVPVQAATLLYSQDFENPATFVNYSNTDVDPFTTVNGGYGNQPPGFQFGQTNTVETLLVGGTFAHLGKGFQDPQNRAGSYVLGMLSTAQNDYLGLSFDVGSNKFLNFKLDLSSIDLNSWGGPFFDGKAPKFEFSLFDNPSGAVGTGSGALLSTAQATGTIAANRWTFDWTNTVVGLSTDGNTNGNVTLRIDLLEGGYAAMDNFVIAAADDPGDVGEVPGIPEPGTWALMLGGLGAIAALSRRRRVR